MVERRFCPVFVIGCPRSGTNLLYDTLLSAGEFAVYRGGLLVYQVLIPRFGRMDRVENRRKMMAVWVRSKGFRRSGLDATELTAKVLETCRSGGDFISTVMGEIARRQHASRWAVYDPENVMRVDTIKREVPDALFVHIIRDGRDVALSLQKLGEFHPFPWNRKLRSLEEHALYWEWLVQKGRSCGREIAGDYMEIHYEELVSEPRLALEKLGRFLDQDLDYGRIQSAALGTLRKTNSAFREENGEGGVSPVQRWKQRLSPEQAASLEWHVGETLRTTGYSLTTPAVKWQPGTADRVLRKIYPSFLTAKLWLKTHTALGRLSNSGRLELAPEAAASVESPSSPSPS